MDGSTFDTLTRTLTTAGSRRGALAGFLGSTLGLVGFQTDEAGAHDLRAKCKKIKDKAKRKKCLKKAKAHNATHLTDTPPPPGSTCTPNCAGKNCGPDGCGGSCGPCNDGTCTDGTCVCRSGEEVCQGRCVAACTAGQVRIPGTCSCCGTRLSSCSQGSQVCCSHICAHGLFCEGRSVGEHCQFDAQCIHGNCTGGECGCPSGMERCPGGCANPCPPNQVRVPGSCSCCIIDDASCASAPNSCCSGVCQQSTNTCRAVIAP